MPDKKPPSGAKPTPIAEPWMPSPSAKPLKAGSSTPLPKPSSSASLSKMMDDVMNELRRSPMRLRPRSSTRRSPIGSTPGVLHGTGSGIPPTLDVIAWNGELSEEAPSQAALEVEAFNADSVQQAYEALERFRYVWLNIRGNSDLETLKDARRIFDLHSLAVEDAWNVPQRSKLDSYERHLFLVLNRIAPALEDASEGEDGLAPIHTQQVSFFIGERYLITVQESTDVIFEPIRQRFLDREGQMKRRTPDYVAYAIADAIIDSCFPVIDDLAEQVETAEATIYVRKHRGIITQLLKLRQQLHELRRLVTPMQAAVRELLHLESPLIHKSTRMYLRDAVDHATRLTEMAETAQDHAKNLLDVHIALSSHEMNEVMKVLTIISTIFIPLSFIAGVYGMNFDPERSPWNMPELSWYFGYPFALLLMLAVGTGFAFYFRSRRWF